jgi:nucleoside-diphosphate-sugar epimerase
MNILIIGSKGYIGSALVNYFKQDHRVVGIDLGWFDKNLDNSSTIVMDFRQAQAKFFDQFNAIILLAGHSSVPMCDSNMLPAFNNNVRNFVELLPKIRKGQKFIYASSSSVYGDTGSTPALESWDRFRPKSYYDLTKQEIDYYAELSNLNYYGLRLGTVNGCGLSDNLRVDIMINKMYHTAKLKNEIQIFNSHISRPILGINDLCNAIESILEGPNNKGVYNLASFNATVGEIANKIKNCLKDVKIENLGNTPSYNFSIDCSKFQNAYNFKFNDTVESIVQDLDASYVSLFKTIRDRRDYV